MPRTPRKPSPLNTHHIVIRGVNQQVIFESPYDRKEFRNILEDSKEIYDYQLHAYCMMTNHVHFLITSDDADLPDIMKYIAQRYAQWFNRKYHRIGHLFQDRYKSKPVCNRGHFLNVFRYIHQNPMRAGLEESPGSLKWSSYSVYKQIEKSIHSSTFSDPIIDPEAALSYFATPEELLDFLKTPGSELCLEYDPASQMSDEEAIRNILAYTGCANLSQIQLYDSKTRNQYLSDLRAYGFTIKQLSRLTGISSHIIHKCAPSPTSHP